MLVRPWPVLPFTEGAPSIRAPSAYASNTPGCTYAFLHTATVLRNCCETDCSADRILLNRCSLLSAGAYERSASMNSTVPNHLYILVGADLRGQ